MPLSHNTILIIAFIITNQTHISNQDTLAGTGTDRDYISSMVQYVSGIEMDVCSLSHPPSVQQIRSRIDKVTRTISTSTYTPFHQHPGHTNTRKLANG